MNKWIRMLVHAQRWLSVLITHFMTAEPHQLKNSVLTKTAGPQAEKAAGDWAL